MEPTPERPACIPDFPYRDGWLGGDAAFSIALPSPPERPESRRTLWLFGDSFVASAPQRDRVGSSFVHNSIGISECGDDGFSIVYHWRWDDAGRARAFFDSGTETRYWWLFDGFVHDGSLYIGLLEIEPAKPEAELGLGFRLAGMKLARVTNPDTPPELWQIETSTLSRSLEAFPGATMRVSGDHVYLFAFTALREGRQPRFLSRLSLQALGPPLPEDLSGALETLGKDGAWLEGFVPDRALLLMDDNATEMSVEHDADAGVWLAIYGSPIQRGEPASWPTPSDRVYLRWAEQLEGPWSERIALHRIPEAEAGGEPGQHGVVCYAAKGHQRFAPPERLLFTYVCNVFTPAGSDPVPGLRALTREMDIYRPRTVIVPLPEPRQRGESPASGPE